MFQLSSKPVIGISGEKKETIRVFEMITRIQAAGGTVVFLEHDRPEAALEDMKNLNALVVMGNRYDIAPEEYGERKHPETMIVPQGDAEGVRDVVNRGRYENRLIAGAIREKLPLLGICGGMQRINVHLGGTLHQHIPDLLKGKNCNQGEEGVEGYTPVEHIHVAAGSRLHGISNDCREIYADWAKDCLAPEIISENSFHHQCVNELGKGLALSAVSEDGIVEAIEPEPSGPYCEQFILGLQFHPECGASKLGDKVAAAVVEQARLHSSDFAW